MKRLIFLGVVAFVCSGATLAAATPEVKAGAQKRYVVLYEKSASADARAARGHEGPQLAQRGRQRPATAATTARNRWHRSSGT